RRDCPPTGIRARPHGGNARRHHRYPVAPQRHRPGSTRNGLALTVSGAHSHTRTTPPNINLPSPDIARLPSPSRRLRSPPANSTLPPSVTCSSSSNTKCIPRPHEVTPTCAWQITPINDLDCRDQPPCHHHA